jgi:hypothetical protein
MLQNVVKTFLAVTLSGVCISMLLLPIFKGQKEQFQLDDSGVYKKIRVEKEEVLGDEDQAEWIGSQFKQWSVLENNADGYKVIYPAGFKIDYSQRGKIVLTPPAGGGQVLGYIKSGELSTVAVVDGLTNKQTELIKAAEVMLGQSFKLTSNPGYNQESAKQRFK